MLCQLPAASRQNGNEDEVIRTYDCCILCFVRVYVCVCWLRTSDKSCFGRELIKNLKKWDKNCRQFTHRLGQARPGHGESKQSWIFKCQQRASYPASQPRPLILAIVWPVAGVRVYALCSLLGCCSALENRCISSSPASQPVRQPAPPPAPLAFNFSWHLLQRELRRVQKCNQA